MENKKQDFKKLLMFIENNNLEYHTFNKIHFENEKFEVVVSDDIAHDGFYYVSIYEIETKTTVAISAKRTMQEVLEIIEKFIK